MVSLPPLHRLLYEPLLRRALEEDLGRAGDLTSDSIAPPDLEVEASIVARSGGRVAGLQVAADAFKLLDPGSVTELHCPDGVDAAPGQTVALIRGKARAILSVERTALNLLARMCGIATTTRDVVAAIDGTAARVTCTRKTTPGLRLLEKYAVRAGGGFNHRFGLDDAVLIKDNHRALAGGVREAVERVRRQVGHLVKVEVEVDTLAELEELLGLDVDAVLLDNMRVDLLKEAVAMVRGRLVTEASGGLTPDTAREVAATGVDLLSLGWLTHSVKALDVSLDLAV
ncbi:MAG: carboxylating nicotinate-nucleotide diphosphorylase [Trueperaceae bacterium]